jgi:cytochrome c-type biogenesis protein CcmH/NrfG/TolB-like protein
MKWQWITAPVFALAGASSEPLHAEPPAHDPAADNSPPKVTLVILPYENRAGNPEDKHWSHSTAGRLADLLRCAESIRVIRGSDYGMRELDIEAGDPIDETQARRIGELTEVRWIVWGSWERTGKEWLLTARILRTAGDDPAGEFENKGEDWFAVVEKTAECLLESIGIEATDAERREMAERPTDSPEACELVSRATLMAWGDDPCEEITALLRQALEIDPGIVVARGQLAACLFTQRKTSQGEELVQRLLEDEPENARVHVMAGYVMLHFNGDDVGAEREFREAIRLDPESAAAHEALGMSCARQERWEDAMVALTKARELAPFESETNALLGFVHIRLGKPEAGLTRLQEAERVGDGEDPATEMWLAMGYRRLADFPKSAQHYERVLALSKEAGTKPDALRSIEKALESVKERLTPTPVEAARPRSFFPEELRAELAKRLTPEELELAVIPFEINDDMKAWVRQKTAGADTELERAKTLFDLLIHRVRGRGKGGTRTAKELFAVWGDQEVTFSCQEYGKLFVGLGREIGLDAYYVHLEKDCDGDVVYHDCAALFLDGKAYLVDPAYRWFGAPHQQFEILDDLQTVAHHAFQPRDEENSLACCRMALKLHPDHAWGRIVVAAAYVKADEFELAEKQLAKAAELEPDRWDWFMIRGLIAGNRGQPGVALENLEEAVARNPESSRAQYFLAMALGRAGKS